MGDRSPKDKNKKKKQDDNRHDREHNQKVVQINEARDRKNGGKDATTDHTKEKEYKKAG